MTDTRMQDNESQTALELAGDEVAPHPYSAIINAGLRSIAASIPVAASLGQVWSEYETHRTTKRIRELFENLKAELKALVHEVDEHGDALKKCQDFAELLEITIDKVRREYGESKRATYARILARLAVEGDQRTHFEKVALLESLDLLTEIDIRILSLFQGRETAEIANVRWRELGLAGEANEQLWEVSCSLAKLESRGLMLKVTTHTGVVVVQPPLSADASRWEQTKYRVLPLGMSLIALLVE